MLVLTASWKVRDASALHPASMLASLFAYELFYYRHIEAVSISPGAVLGEPRSAALP